VNPVQGKAADVGHAAERGEGTSAMRLSEPAARPVTEAGRRRAAVELIARHGPTLRQTARRYSLCADDAEDAYQRTLEILLTKAPSDRARELLGWTRTVVKHEALAIRRSRERLLRPVPPSAREGEDWVALIPTDGDGPGERLERREEIARSREALRALKPAELRALTLLAEGYSYAEIGALTGFSRTKVNRCLAEGRERFRQLLSNSEDGSRCAEMSRLLSAFCDGETRAEETAVVREHLRACARCRATVRAYRTAPATAAALAPALPLTRSLLERAQEFLLGLQSRLPGAGGAADASIGQVAAAGGTKGAGVAALTKLLAVCAGTVGGAACVATGVAPVPVDLTPDRVEAPRVERVSERVIDRSTASDFDDEPAPVDPALPEPPVAEKPTEAAEPTPSPAQTEVVEVTEATPSPPAPSAAPTIPSAESPSRSSGSAAGEFGP
jgi:RNA polymerase sigma factor (sigma-70 family)